MGLKRQLKNAKPLKESMERLCFLTPVQVEAIQRKFGTPVYVYDERFLRANAEVCLRFPNAYGLTVRYAMKAGSNATILQLFNRLGLHFDASSGYECERAINAGIAPQKISLSSQEFPVNFAELYKKGITFNACSLHQIKCFGEIFPEQTLGLRFNPGLGSGGTNRTNTGGPASSFGIWHEWIEEAKSLIEKYRLKIFRIHTHIGSGSDSAVWQCVSHLSLDLVRRFPEVTILNLGGGFKVGRMSHEKTTDLIEIGRPVRDAFVKLFEATGRKIHLEIEPGSYLVTNACSLIALIQDIVSTGKTGYTFLKLDTGMTEILRPSLYGAEHPLIVLPRKNSGHTHLYVAMGHCCESGDLLTPAAGQPEVLQPRELSEAAIGDLCVIEGVGAYCSSMPAKNYNSFPESPEVLLRETGEMYLIRKRQTLAQIVQNEMPLDF